MYQPLTNTQKYHIYDHFRHSKGANDSYIEVRLVCFDLLAKRYDLSVAEVFEGNEKAHWPEEFLSKFREDGENASIETWSIDEIFDQRQYDDADRYNRLAKAEPPSLHAWFFGDETALSNDHRQLRIKFFNAKRYRKNVLELYINKELLTEDQLDDFAAIEQALLRD